MNMKCITRKIQPFVFNLFNVSLNKRTVNDEKNGKCSKELNVLSDVEALHKKSKCGILRKIGIRTLSGIAGIIGAGVGMALGPICGIAGATYTAFTGKAPSKYLGKDHWIDGWVDVDVFDEPAKLALHIKKDIDDYSIPRKIAGTALSLTTLPYAAVTGIGIGAVGGFIIPAGTIMETIGKLGKHC